MITVSPSILAADFANLERDVQKIKKSGSDWVHVDVMDGVFVPNITIGIPVVNALRKVTDLPLDVHLMIAKPIRYIADFVKAGADWLTIHVEADTQENIQDALDQITRLGCKAAISLKPGTPAEAAKPYLDKVSMILVMTVEPGFGGQSFRADMLPKLRTLREMLDRVNPECVLSVDGGINMRTAQQAVSSGASVLVMGSAFFGAEDKAGFTRELRQLADSVQ